MCHIAFSVSYCVLCVILCSLCQIVFSVSYSVPVLVTDVCGDIIIYCLNWKVSVIPRRMKMGLIQLRTVSHPASV